MINNEQINYNSVNAKNVGIVDIILPHKMWRYYDTCYRNLSFIHNCAVVKLLVHFLVFKITN